MMFRRIKVLKIDAFQKDSITIRQGFAGSADEDIFGAAIYMGLGACSCRSPARTVNYQVYTQSAPIGKLLCNIIIGDGSVSDMQLAILARDRLMPAAVIGVHRKK